MDKNKRIPKVRYKGFEDEWENMDASKIFKHILIKITQTYQSFLHRKNMV